MGQTARPAEPRHIDDFSIIVSKKRKILKFVIARIFDAWYNTDKEKARNVRQHDLGGGIVSELFLFPLLCHCITRDKIPQVVLHTFLQKSVQNFIQVQAAPFVQPFQAMKGAIFMPRQKQETQLTPEELRQAARAYATQARAEYYKRHPEMKIAHRLTASANLLARFHLINGSERDAIVAAIPEASRNEAHND